MTMSLTEGEGLLVYIFPRSEEKDPDAWLGTSNISYIIIYNLYNTKLAIDLLIDGTYIIYDIFKVK